MRSFSATRMFAAALLLLLGIAFVHPARAQEQKDDPGAENQENEGDDDSGKETCNPPEFTFTWQGYDLVKVTARADPAQAFIIKLNYLEPPRKEKGWESGAFKKLELLPARATGPQKACADHKPSGNGFAEGVSFCLNATEDGSTAALFMDRQALLQAGGLPGPEARPRGSRQKGAGQAQPELRYRLRVQPPGRWKLGCQHGGGDRRPLAVV